MKCSILVIKNQPGQEKGEAAHAEHVVSAATA